MSLSKRSAIVQLATNLDSTSAMPVRFTGEIDLEARPAADDLACCFQDGRLLVEADGEAAEIPAAGRLQAAGVPLDHAIYLGRLDGRPCFALELASDAGVDGLQAAGLRELFGKLPADAQSVAGRAFQTLEWYRNHAFCGRCGNPTVLADAERARACPRCGASFYPRINPAVIMLVEREGRILLAHNRNFRGAFYSCLAGFVDPGESLEEAVAREVLEETGIEVERITYFASQPWPFPSQLMVGFTAQHAGGEIRLGGDPEIEDARWFGRDEMPQLPGRFSLARRLIDGFLERP
jgi:NAD+ diphosphatase